MITVPMFKWIIIGKRATDFLWQMKELPHPIRVVSPYFWVVTKDGIVPFRLNAFSG